MPEKVLKLLLPLTIVGFMGPSIRFLNPFLNSNTRWIFLGLITLYCLFASTMMRQIGYLLMLLFVSATWNTLTCLWSEQFNLSLFKSVGWFMSSLFVLMAGFQWSTRFEVRKSLGFLTLFSLVSLFSTIAGYFFSPRPFHTVGFYMGWCSNVNMNGVLTSITSGYLLWLMYKHNANKKLHSLLFALYAVNLVAVVATGSRAAILIVIMILLGYTLGSCSKKLYLIAPAALAVLGLAMLSYEPLKDAVFKKLIYKFESEALTSRRDPWQQSLDGALEGGFLGGGYGVSIGFNKDWQGERLSATDEAYGREKGNSQLAVIEETGLIGFCFYFTLQCYILICLVRGTLRTRDGDRKVSLGIVTGMILGLFVQSFFEGWYVAPGALESIMFWSMTGVGFGLVPQEPESVTATGHTAVGLFRGAAANRITG